MKKGGSLFRLIILLIVLALLFAYLHKKAVLPRPGGKTITVEEVIVVD